MQFARNKDAYLSVYLLFWELFLMVKSMKKATEA
jgi:hypothetical protein